MRAAAMQKFSGIQLVTVDLDDTLWPLAQVTQHAEAGLYEWFEANSPVTAAIFPPGALRALKQEVERGDPRLKGNYREALTAALRLAFQRAGDAEDKAEQAFEVYWAARHEVPCFDDVIPALDRLRQRYRLAAITNGVTDLSRTKLRDYFEFVLMAGEVGGYKPARSIFRQACRRAGVVPTVALHVGDDIDCDVRGALSVGMHAAWVNRDQWSLRLLAPPAITVPNLVALADRLEAGV